MVEGRTHIPVVDEERCFSCLTCVHACPVWVLKGLKEEKDSLRAAVARGVLFPDLDPPDGDFEVPPCIAACPLGQDVPGYIGAIAGGDVEAAAKIILKTNPLPSVLGKVCMRPCVKACIRGKIEESPDIRGLKHFAASQAHPRAGEALTAKPSKLLIQRVARASARATTSRGKRVAVIGAGPAGLSAAGMLARQGLGVTVYDKNTRPGGMLMYGLGEFDLPYADLKRDIDRILAEGVELETGVDITSLEEIEREGVDAILIATGASAASALFEQGLRGTRGAKDVTSFMRDVRTGKAAPIGRNAVVEGYGPWALTAARAALGLGAKSVTLISPFPTAHDDVEEGIDVLAPARVVSFVKSSSRLTAVRCARVSYGRRDIRGRMQGEKLAETLTLKSSFYISAMDLATDCCWAFDQAGIGRGVAGTIHVDPDTLMTGRSAVFAAGDVTTGPRSVLSAAAMGVKAAGAILKYLAEKK